VHGWRFQSRFDDLPGGANDAPTAPWKIAGSHGGVLGLAAFSRYSIRVVVQNKGVECLDELAFLSVSLIIELVLSKPGTMIRYQIITHTDRIVLQSTVVHLRGIIWALKTFA